MKIMSKVKIIKKNSIKNVLNEKNLLSQLHNSFLINMFFSFQDNDNLYLIMDLLLGGDLRYHLNKREKFNENQLRFFISCTILGLNYLHQNKIIHKDIKPENLVFDIKGYLHITDLGISKIYHEENKEENSGTLGYMAPEVLFNKNHDYSVDFFALGVIGYEIIKGERPYKGKDKKELRKDVMSRQAKLEEEEFWSKNCIDFINSLLQRKKENRLGYNNINELMEHPWFTNFNWNELASKKMKPFWEPKNKENYYHDFQKEEDVGKETELCYKEIKSRKEYSKYFEDYSFNEKDLNKKENKIEEKTKVKRNELKKKFRYKYEITSQIINKLKKEIKKSSFPNFNIYQRNNSLNKNSLHFSVDNFKKIDFQKKPKKENSFYRITNSHYLYNNSQDVNLRTSNKFHKSNNHLINLSTKYNNNKEGKFVTNERIKFDNKSNDNKKLYRYIYNHKFYVAPKINNKINLNFNTMKKNFYFNKISDNNLPKINQLKKSSSVENFEKIKNGKKSKLRIED